MSKGSMVCATADVVQVLIYKALGWKQPQFSHVSLILAPDRSKLSKRHGATSLDEFRQQGFLPQAMLNYLTLLGWNDGSEQEVFTLQELQVTIPCLITNSFVLMTALTLPVLSTAHLVVVHAAMPCALSLLLLQDAISVADP